MPRRLLNLFPHLIVAVKVEDVGYEVEGILVVLDFGVQARKVEAVGQVFFVDLAEVLISSGRYELYGLSARLCLVSVVVLWAQSNMNVDLARARARGG
jgi:hypothetical protein